MEERRVDDVQIAILRQEFKDFVARYERDTGRAEVERANMMKVITSHDEFIREIKPMYSKTMIAVGAFCLGLIGLGASWVWTHLRWGNP